MGAPDDDLISIYEFAHRYRVDISVVRGWVKRGDIPYTLVGYRKMLRHGDIPKLVKAVDPVERRKDWNMRQLVRYLVDVQGLDIETARMVVSNMSPDEVATQLVEFKQPKVQAQAQQSEEHEHGEGQKQRSDSPRPTGARKGSADHSKRRAPDRRSR